MKLSLYVDGSYSKNRPDEVYGGWVIVDENDNAVLAQRVHSTLSSMISMNNVGGELLATLAGASMAVNTMKSLRTVSSTQDILTIYHDYAGIELFIQGSPRWVAKKPGSILYTQVFNALKYEHKEVYIRFQKVKAHTGNKWNEIADAIANGICPKDVEGILLEQIEF